MRFVRLGIENALWVPNIVFILTQPRARLFYLLASFCVAPLLRERRMFRDQAAKESCFTSYLSDCLKAAETVMASVHVPGYRSCCLDHILNAPNGVVEESRDFALDRRVMVGQPVTTYSV